MEEQKPFACKAEGCKMSFTNEDHLSVHTKKHAMVLHLSLNNKAANFLADQTPTPTRLIKNCDEVGLFDDLHLQNVNPFDETFRRAVESKETELTPTILLPTTEVLSGEETLHTPHVLPYFQESDTIRANLKKKLKICTKLTKKCPDEKLSLSSETSESEVSQVSSRVPHLTLQSSDAGNINTPATGTVTATGTVRPIKIKIAPILPEANTNLSFIEKNSQNQLSNQIVQIEVVSSSTINELNSSVKSRPLLLPKATIATNQSAISLVRARLKEALLKNSTELQQNVNSNTTVNNSTNLKEVRKTEKSKNCIVVEKRQKISDTFAERNKAAALRYRRKIKSWYKDLEQKNKDLELENENLKQELSQLRAVMLAHQDCSVSKAMAMGHNIPIGLPKLIITDNSSMQIESVDGNMGSGTKSVYFLVNKSNYQSQGNR